MSDQPSPQDMIRAIRNAAPNLRSVEIQVIDPGAFAVVVDPYNEGIKRLIQPAVTLMTPEGMQGRIRGKYKLKPDPNVMGKTIRVPWEDE